MKDVYAVLHQKEIALARVREEIEALRFVIPLLEEETPTQEDTPHAPAVGDAPAAMSRRGNKWPLHLRNEAASR
jgi:hypothetical protein